MTARPHARADQRSRRSAPVLNTHLHTTAVDRLMQTADIAAVIDAAPAGPMALVDDFNARPTAAEMTPIYLVDRHFRDGTKCAERLEWLGAA
jgi:endonuclease/exonuclease/phosphatase family metal-dependent hydrolase